MRVPQLVVVDRLVVDRGVVVHAVLLVLLVRHRLVLLVRLDGLVGLMRQLVWGGRIAAHALVGAVARLLPR